MNPLDLTETHPSQRSARRTLSLVRKLAPALLLSLAPVLGAGQPAVVHAASGDCTPSGSQIGCTFTYTGDEQTWQVPPGISSVTITAVGGSGSSYVPAETAAGTAGTTVPGGKGGAGDRHRAAARRHDGVVRRGRRSKHSKHQHRLGL